MKVAAVLFGLVGVSVALAAQGSAPADGTTQALVTELRALRADLNRIAGSSIRTQLLVGRLQLQEQRILAVNTEISSVQKELAQRAQERTALQTQLENAEQMQAQSAEERRAVEDQLRMLRPHVVELKQREQQLRARHSELSAMLADEQSRWSDFNSRLDDLERALVVPRP
jgi:chromosome segregation ATPase